MAIIWSVTSQRKLSRKMRLLLVAPKKTVISDKIEADVSRKARKTQ